MFFKPEHRTKRAVAQHAMIGLVIGIIAAIIKNN